MPFCPECGAKHDGAKFCPNCGLPQPGTGDAESTSVAPAGGAATPPPAQTSEAPEETLWEGESKNVKNVASGGRVVQARYRLTNRALYWSRGVLTTNSEQIPLWAVRDIDVKQNLLQKRRGVGDVRVWCQHDDYTGRAWVRLESVEAPHEVRDLLNQQSQQQRLWYDERARTKLYSHRS